jgi:NAD(P)-dependent dehydrogenase (short-subunit alcohol dehydrogenase family)
MSSTIVILGASSGIGRALARRCLDKGHVVHGLARRAEALASIEGVVAHALDGRDAEALRGVLEAIGGIDHLVLTMNAGSAVGAFAGLSLDRIRAAFDNKVFPYMQAIIAAAPLLSKEGSITLVTGAAGRSAQVGMGVLASTNGALNHLTEVLALELAPIRVNAVAPGVIATDYWAGVPEGDRANFFATVAAKTPVPRIGTADEIADAIVFAIDNRFMTGAIIDCDGGARLK